MVGVLAPQLWTVSNPPIMWRWLNHAGYILSQCLCSQNVAVFHSDNWMMVCQEMRKQFYFDGNQDIKMETNFKKNIWILRHFQHYNDHICSTLPNLLVWPNINLAQQCSYNLVHSASQLSTVYTVPTQAGDLCGESLDFDIDNLVKLHCSFTLE